MNLWPNFDLKFDPILQGKKGKNKPEIHKIEKWPVKVQFFWSQRWALLAKVSQKIHNIEIWPKLRPKVINSRNKSHRDHIWGMFELYKWS